MVLSDREAGNEDDGAVEEYCRRGRCSPDVGVERFGEGESEEGRPDEAGETGGVTSRGH